MTSPRVVLVAIDGSDHAEQALDCEYSLISINVTYNEYTSHCKQINYEVWKWYLDYNHFLIRVHIELIL